MEWLEGRDALFLYLETARTPMHVVFTGIFDPAAGAPRERLRDVVEARLHVVPRLRQRVREVPFGVHHPALIDDPDFDLDHHLHQASLPPPGGLPELADFVAGVAGRPLDRQRPLWEVHVVEGLAQGRWAIVAKTHHAVIDGIGGNELMVNLFDLSSRPRTVSPPDEPWEPEEQPSDLALLAGAVRANLSSPARVLQAAGRSAGVVRDVVRKQGDDAQSAPLTLGPRTILNHPVGVGRQVAFTDLSLSDLKAIKATLGSTVNDLVLAVVGRALRRFLAAHSEEPDGQLVAAVPISTRTHDDTGPGNRLSGMTVPLADDIPDPVEQLHSIQGVTSAAADLWGAIGAELLQDWTQFAVPAVAAQAFRFYSGSRLSARHRPLANLMISNLPGPSAPLYVAGARLEAMYSIGSVLAGQALNITVASYEDCMHVGIVAARDTVPALDGLVSELHDALDAFRQVAMRRPVRRADG
jgi:diacylglycerol O-acyltransferase / wax synthase